MPRSTMTETMTDEASNNALAALFETRTESRC
jgi:hypothetical protein